MREIKFRAWDNINKRMAYLNYLKGTPFGTIVSENHGKEKGK